MSPEAPPEHDAAESALIAAAVRAGIDAILAERAPADRDAFWNAVAVHYARSPGHRDPAEPRDEPQPDR